MTANTTWGETKSWLGLIRWDTPFAALLTLGSYPLFFSTAWLLPTSTVGLIFAATMLQNADDDRCHDYLREDEGRKFAYRNSKTLESACSFAWIGVVILLALNALHSSWWEVGILTGMAIGGRFYSRTRHYTGASMLVVAAVFTAPLLLGVTELTPRVIADAATFFVFILVLEIGSDLSDHVYDVVGRWKKTLPVMLGVERARWVYVALSTIPPLAIQVIAGAHEISPSDPRPTSLSVSIVLSATFLTILGGFAHILRGPSKYAWKETLTWSKMLHKVAMVLFIVGFMLD